MASAAAAGAYVPSLIANDPIVARNFFMTIPGADDKLTLLSVSGVEVELDVVQTQANGKDGKQQHIKTLGGILKAPDVTVTRLAPLDAKNDPLWIWFRGIRDTGMKASDRAQHRKNVAIMFFDGTFEPIATFDLFNTWPSKIATDQVSSDSNEPMKETITLVTERIERSK